MKFIRRAVEDDKNLGRRRCSGRLTTSTCGWASTSPTSSSAGFPKTREELFAYRGIILGSIEAGAFTGDQLRMIAEFVDRRGGGLLMLGGPRSFSEGGYAGTPVADALPVVDRTGRAIADDLPVSRLKVRPTRAGEAHAVTQIAATEEASSERWNELPVLTSVNPLKTLKPGATVLLSGTDENAPRRSRCWPSSATAAARRWRFRPGLVALADARERCRRGHDARELLASAAAVAGGRRAGSGRVAHRTERVEAGEPVTLTAEVVDKSFVELNDARVIAKVKARRQHRRGADAVDR